jgi:hypothetical protein
MIDITEVSTGTPATDFLVHEIRVLLDRSRMLEDEIGTHSRRLGELNRQYDQLQALIADLERVVPLSGGGS